MLDAHVHLADPAFSTDREAVLARAVERGVDRFLCCGTSEADWEDVKQLAAAEPPVVPAFGLHPWHTGTRSKEWKDVLTEFLSTGPAAIGEIGIDGAMKNPPAEGGLVFIEQLELAARLGIPACVHCVRAWEPLVDAIHPFAGRVPIMIHGFGGPVQVMKRLEAQGCSISFSCSVLDPKRKHARAAAEEVRLDRILVESDAPFMPPASAFRPGWMKVDRNGSARNEPAMTATVLETIAELKQIPADALAEAVQENAEQFLHACIREE